MDRQNWIRRIEKSRGPRFAASLLLATTIGGVVFKDYLTDAFLDMRALQIVQREQIFAGIFEPNGKFQDFERNVGVNLDMYAWYEKWSQPISDNKLRIACETGKTPHITWESWSGGGKDDNSFPLKEIAAGTFDGLVVSELTKIRTICGEKPVFMRFDHEMNTRERSVWYPWQGDPEAYIAAWQRVVGLSREVAPNIQWVWGPVHLDNPERYEVGAYYPGDEYVDVLGTTIHNFYPGNPNIGRSIPWESFEDLYSPQRAAILNFGKPVIISETATGEGRKTDDKARWIQEMATYIVGSPEIIGVAYFNNDASREYPAVRFELDSTPQARYAFIQSVGVLQEQPK